MYVGRKMFNCCVILIVLLYFSESFGVRQTDTNLIRIVSPSAFARYPYSYENRRSVIDNQISFADDYDDYSGGYPKLPTPLRPKYASENAFGDDKIPLKVHKPKEDPKLFYQSEAYYKEVKGQNFNREVAAIYPGREVVRADEKHRIAKHLLRNREQNRIPNHGFKICVRCPADRTLIAKVGADQVILQTPILTTCSGRKAPKNVRFVHMFGPKFGTLMPRGSHIVIGRIMHKNSTLQICRIQVHVIIQSCATPNYLISHCVDRNQICNFTCRDESMELHGATGLTCEDDMRWSGNLPVCRVRNWCPLLPPPDHGRISCKGATAGLGVGLVEGSRCRVRCSVGWRWAPRAVAVCRRGIWSNALKCQPKKS